MDIYSSQGSTRASFNDSASFSEQPTSNFWQQMLSELIRDMSDFSLNSADAQLPPPQIILTTDNLTLVGTDSPQSDIAARLGALSGERADALHAETHLPGLLRCLTGSTDPDDGSIVPPARSRTHSNISVSSVLSDTALGNWGQG